MNENQQSILNNDELMVALKISWSNYYLKQI